MTPHDRFIKLIEGFTTPERDDLAGVENDFVLDADGPVQLTLSPEREEITFSTNVFCATDQPDLIRPELMAQFNAYHILHGGYHLSLAGDADLLRLNQRKSLARLESMGLDSFMEEFIARCASCTRWYLAETTVPGSVGHAFNQLMDAL